MTIDEAKTLGAGDRIQYDDGRLGHVGVFATVLEVRPLSMIVQFDDRADMTTIMHWDSMWMDYVKAVGVNPKGGAL
jgi:hypothetical protein